MKTQINPIVAVVVVVVVIAAVGLLLYSRAGGGEPQYGAKIPDVVMKEFKEKGPRPMPPMPMPNGGTVTPSGGAVAPPKAASGAK